MIKLIGIKRAMILGILLALNLAIAAVFFMWIMPAKSDAELQLATVNGQIADFNSKIQNIKRELDDFKTRLPLYEALQNDGFFLTQDRFMIGRTLDTLREKSGVIGFSYDIGDLTDVKNDDAAAIDYRLVDSRINIQRISSALDTNLFDLMRDISGVFPAQTRIQSFTITKPGDVTQEKIDAFLKKPDAGFITADVTMDWLTMIPVTAGQTAPDQGGFRGQ